jgi:hypothetical protein
VAEIRRIIGEAINLTLYQALAFNLVNEVHPATAKQRVEVCASIRAFQCPPKTIKVQLTMKASEVPVCVVMKLLFKAA